MAKPNQADAKAAETPIPSVAQSVESSDGAELVRKLSPKSIIGKVRVPSKPTVLYVVLGNTHGIKEGTGDNGPWIAFLGSFEAHRISEWSTEAKDYVPSDHRRYQSGQCFVPKAVEDVLASVVRQAKKDDAGNSIEFAIEVGVKPADTIIGYEYTVKNLVKTTGADPLAALRAKVNIAGYLPGPK